MPEENKREETYAAQVVRAMDTKRKSDMACKTLLKSRWILANLLQGLVSEFECISTQRIVDEYLEPGELYEPVGALAAETVHLEDRESNEADAATIYYDVKFRVTLPNRTKTQVYLLVDVEAQNAYYPGYPIEKRMEYYLSRMISEQIKTVSRDTDYSVLQKVYSIWICMGNSIPKAHKQTITRYEVAKRDVFGGVNVPLEAYDLMTGYIIRLGETSIEQKTLGLLQTIFTEKLAVEERLNRLEEQYGIPRTRKFEREVEDMCTYSQYVEEKGMAEGMEKGLAKGELNKAKKVAIEMLKEEEPLEKIKRYTKLSETEIEALKSERCAMAE